MRFEGGAGFVRIAGGYAFEDMDMVVVGRSGPGTKVDREQPRSMRLLDDRRGKAYDTFVAASFDEKSMETVVLIGPSLVVSLVERGLTSIAGDAEAAKPLIGPATVVQTPQIGLGSPEKVAAILGPNRLSVGVVGGFGASVPTPGETHHSGMEMIRFSAYESLPEDDLRESAGIWTSAGFEVKIFEDTDQMVWDKFIMNVAFSGTTCATGLPIGGVIADPDAWTVAEACCGKRSRWHTPRESVSTSGIRRRPARTQRKDTERAAVDAATTSVDGARSTRSWARSRCRARSTEWTPASGTWFTIPRCGLPNQHAHILPAPEARKRAHFDARDVTFAQISNPTKSDSDATRVTASRRPRALRQHGDGEDFWPRLPAQSSSPIRRSSRGW